MNDKPIYSPMTIPMETLLEEILGHPGIVVGGPFHRSELRTALALEKRGRIRLVPLGTGQGFKVYPIGDERDR